MVATVDLSANPHQLVAGASIVGSRSEQQDRYGFNWIEEDQAWLIVLADGMGGHNGGAIASKIVVDGFTAAFYLRRKQKLPLNACFEESLAAANSLLADAQSDNVHLSGMGTTFVAAYISGAGLIWTSVGDSPLWLWRSGQMLRLNDDHSLRAVAGVSGRNANMLQSALNGQPIPLIDSQFEPVVLQPKDAVILSSDGLLTLDEKAIGKVTARHFPSCESIANALVGAVTKRRKSNQDNCTVVVAAPFNVSASSTLSPTMRLWKRVKLGKILLVFGLFVVLGLLAFGLYFWLARFNS